MAYVPPALRKSKGRKQSGESKHGHCCLSIVADYFRSQKLSDSDDLFSIFDDFCNEFKDAFKSDHTTGDGTGLPLHYTSLHDKYLKEFSRTVEWVLEVNKADENDFYKECKMTLAGNPPSSFDEDKHQWFVDAMMAALDFKYFLKRMKKKASGK